MKRSLPSSFYIQIHFTAFSNTFKTCMCVSNEIMIVQCILLLLQNYSKKEREKGMLNKRYMNRKISIRKREFN